MREHLTFYVSRITHHLSRFVSLRTILIAFILLSALYSSVTPIFESPDEWLHYPLVKHLADGHALPVHQPGVKTLWEQEGSQPPLYYLLMAAATRWIDTSDLPDRLYRNPHAAIGDASLQANRNLMIHTAAEDFPWRGTTLAVHLIRFLSIGLGALTVGLGFGMARRIFPERRSIALGTAAAIAFNPMFVFLSGTVNNDNLIITLSTLAIYLLVMCLLEPAIEVDRAGWLRRAELGVVAGLAALTKVSGLTLLPVIGLGLTIRHVRRRDWRGWIVSGLLIGLPTVAIAGGWYWRNWALYGEWLGLRTMVAVYAQPRVLPATLDELIREFEGFRYSYWAVLGIFNILTLPAAYVVFDIFTLVGLIGWLIFGVRAWRRADRDRVAVLTVLAAFALIVLAGVIQWTIMIAASQGRLMFPAIAAIALMLWLGWETVWSIADLRSRILDVSARVGRVSIPVFMLILTLIIPFRDIAPTYVAPARLALNELPPDLITLDVDYGYTMRLLGYLLPQSGVASGTIEFTLYWQCRARPPSDYSVYAIVYGRRLEELGKRDAYPNRGLFATRECEPGMVFADPYRIALKSDAVRPALLRVQVGLRDWVEKVDLPSSVGTLIFVAGKLGPIGSNGKPQYRDDWRLGEAIALVGYSCEREARAGTSLKLSLFWRGLSTPPESYTVFVHLLDDKGQLVGQADGLPLDGDYPTDWWAAGEVVVDDRILGLPSHLPGGDYHLAVGLYRLSDGSRLPVVDTLGNRQPEDRIILESAVYIRP